MTAPSIDPLVSVRGKNLDVTGTATPHAPVTLTIDPDNDPLTDNAVVYLVTADAQGRWMLNTATTPPQAGTIPEQAKQPGTVLGITAVAHDTFGNPSTPVFRAASIGYQLIIPMLLHAGPLIKP